MTKDKTTKGGLIAVALCLIAAACLAIFGNSSGRSQEPAGQQPSSDDDALRRAVMQDGLRGAAKLKGIYFEELNPHLDWARFNVEELTKGSASVIVGRFTKKLDGHLKGRHTILTDYEVSVEEIEKGDLKKDKTIVVHVPGGRVFFEDGTSAEQTTPTFEQPQIGHAYAIFLTEDAECLPRSIYPADPRACLIFKTAHALNRMGGQPIQPRSRPKGRTGTRS